MKGWWLEFRLAFNSLSKVPNYVLAVVSTLGVSLGALMVLSVLGYLLHFTPLPYADHERLYVVKGALSNNGNQVMANVNSFAGATRLYNMQPELEQAAMLSFSLQQIDSHPQLPIVTTSYVSPEFFSLLNIPLALGRGFTGSEAYGSENPVVVLSYQAWQQYFAGRSNIVGETINIGEKSFQVVGVAAARFEEPVFYNQEFNGSDVWLPIDFRHDDKQAENDWGAMNPFITVIAKLNTAISKQQAESVMSDKLNTAFAENLVFPEDQQLPFSMSVELSDFEQVILGDSRRTVLLLLVGALVLLLIALSNVLNLMLSRTVQKQKQLTIRAIIGANRWHLFKSILAENLLLMSAVSLLSVMVTWLGFDVLRNLASDYLPRLAEMELGVSSLALTFVIAACMAFVLSVLSGRIVEYSRLQGSIQSSGKGSGLQISPRVRMWLISSQIALTGLLIAASMNVLKTAMDVIWQEPGFGVDGLSYLSLNYRGDALSPEERGQIALNIKELLVSQPNIEGVAISSSEPTRSSGGGSVLRYSDDKNPVNAMFTNTDQDVFNVIEQPLIEGRTFSAIEVRDSARVVVITRALAEALYPNESALGKALLTNMNTALYQIIGVVENLNLPPLAQASLGGADMAEKTLYLPGLFSPTVEEFRYIIRGQSQQPLRQQTLLDTITRAEPDMRLWSLEAATQRQRQLVSHELMLSKVTLGLTIMSMLLAGVGLYGVLNYSTQLRRYELGTRISLGAAPSDIVKLVFISNLKPLLIGMTISVIAGVVAYGMTRQYIEGIFVPDLASLSVAALCMVMIAALSCYLPLHTIVRQWPIHSLRS
ncbi:MAG: ABC transporter permease [Pseudomonadota bacterium]